MNYKAVKNQITRSILLLACTTTLAVGFMVSIPQSAHAQTITPPEVPPGSELEVESGNEPFLLGRGVGTQNYVCSPCDQTNELPFFGSCLYIIYTAGDVVQRSG